MCVYVSVYVYVSVSVAFCVCMYIYKNIYLYIYIYICTARAIYVWSIGKYYEYKSPNEWEAVVVRCSKARPRARLM